MFRVPLFWDGVKIYILSYVKKNALNVTGTVAHIMARCLSSEVLFNDDADRSVFLSLFGKYLDLVDYRCYAYLLMSNHFHFVNSA